MNEKIIFICTGNTCRSVMAERIFESLKKANGLENIMADSAGIAAMPHYAIVGDLKDVMDEKGIDYSGHQAKMINQHLVQESRLLLVMTKSHKDYLITKFSNMADKVMLLREYAIDDQKDIIDPIGLGKDAYRQAFQEIEICVKELIRKLKDES